MIKTSTKQTATALLACALAMLGGAVHAHAGSRETLTPTGVDADATGDAKVNVKSRASGLRGKLDVRGRRLDPSAAYQVTIDGVRIGSFTTSRGGMGKVRFDTSPNRNDQLLGVDPRGRVLGVVDPSGAVVLSTTLTAGGQIGGSDTRCCLPDGGGDGPAECEDRTPAECIAQGGIDLGPGSCLPNPCEGPTPPPAGSDIRCCLPDGGGDGPAECEDRTPAQCAAEGGVNIGAGACAPGACEPTTPPPGGGNGNAVARVRCERRGNRSKISVDASGVAAGSYTARVTSGANTAAAGEQAAVGDEVEFDFDSDTGDIAAGATAIPGDFIQGLQVTGEVLDGSGAVVASSTETCLSR